MAYQFIFSCDFRGELKMVRNYKKQLGSRTYRNYSEETLQLAVSQYKKLNVAAGKSISKEDLEVPEVPGTSTPQKVKTQKKKKVTLRQSSSSSKNDVNIDEITIDSDLHPETFSDLENENDIENDKNICNAPPPTKNNFSGELTSGDYIFVNMKTEAGTKKQFVAKIVNCEGPTTYLCTFLRKSNKIPNAYVYPPAEDIGIIEKEEVQQKLLEIEVLRRGQIKFNDLKFS